MVASAFELKFLGRARTNGEGILHTTTSEDGG